MRNGISISIKNRFLHIEKKIICVFTLDKIKPLLLIYGKIYNDKALCGEPGSLILGLVSIIQLILACLATRDLLLDHCGDLILD